MTRSKTIWLRQMALPPRALRASQPACYHLQPIGYILIARQGQLHCRIRSLVFFNYSPGDAPGILRYLLSLIIPRGTPPGPPIPTFFNYSPGDTPGTPDIFLSLTISRGTPPEPPDTYFSSTAISSRLCQVWATLYCRGRHNIV
jgi:hypothetical protein